MRIGERPHLEARNSRTINAWHWPPMSRSTFVMILAPPGSAADYCASISRVAPICPCTVRPSSVPSHGSSMKGREKTLLYQTLAEKFAERIAAGW